MIAKILQNEHYETSPGHRRLWDTSIRLAANAVAASTYLSGRGDANALQNTLQRCRRPYFHAHSFFS